MIVDVYVDGHWDDSLMKVRHVVIWDKGQVYQVQEDKYKEFLQTLHLHQIDRVFCPQKSNHPNWNGIIKYQSDPNLY